MDVITFVGGEEQSATLPVSSLLATASAPALAFSVELEKAASEDSGGTAASVGEERSAEEQQQAEDAAKRSAATEYLNKWVRSAGAPEELEQQRVEDVRSEDEDGDGIPDHLQRSFNPNALETFSQTISDPEDEDKTHVIVAKADGEGKVKITRTVTVDTGGDKNNNTLNPDADKAAANTADTDEKTGEDADSPSEDEEKSSILS